MSILKTTNSGIYQQITYDYLVKEGYITADTHAIKIGPTGATYELSKRIGEKVYKAHIFRKVEVSSTHLSYIRETYTFFIKTIKDLKTMENYWDNPNPKTLYDLIYTVENICNIS